MIEVIPAIDVSGGKVVRLAPGGVRDDVTVFGDDPASMAAQWEGLGAPRLHVIDIDGAFAGHTLNRRAIERLIARAGVPVQVGGGIRTLDAAAAWIDAGADRVVLGTKAIVDRDFLDACLARWRDSVIVAVDAHDGEIRVSGWAEDSGLDLFSTAADLAAAGVPRFLCTDIGREGRLSGPDAELYTTLCEAAMVPVIASGGVASVDDLLALGTVEGIEGAVVGSALYRGAIKLEEALRGLGGQSERQRAGPPVR